MTKTSLRERIVDTALELAERRGWEAVRLHDVATELGIGLDDIRQHFREKEEIVDAWFDRADQAMLKEGATPEMVTRTPRERLHRLLMTWLAALAAHKNPTCQMIANKLEPGHVHYVVGGLLHVSRTVQWWREAASRDAALPRRAVEETVLTSIYLATFVRWMRDDSTDAANTGAFLDKLLAVAERAEKTLGFGSHA
jgi:AcrR family transcriptional regulator